MKKMIRVLGGAVALSYVLSLVGPVTIAQAAAKPSLGAAETFSVLAQTLITGTGTISGDVGMNGSGANITALTSANVAGTIYATDLVAPSEAIISPTVQANASTVYTATIPGLAIEGAPIAGGVLDAITRGPGVYDLGAGTLSGGVLTLDGAGTYIFRTTTTLVSSGTVNLINGARACDVFWNVGTAATINGTSFVGTILAGTGVHIGAGVTLNGRALAVGGDVTLLGTTISGPSCAAAPSSSSTDRRITVIKNVINDNGRTKVAADFSLFVNATPVMSGVPNIFPVASQGSTFTITETADAQYSRSFSGDCDANGQIQNLGTGDKICILTNNDIGAAVVVPPVPPLIDVVKVPSPLSLPLGPGQVNYTYTTRNIGTVPMTNVTMVGDTCSPITLTSGDTNNNAILEVNETWVYNCSTTLNETHTNTVVATGWANGLSAVDVASATVVVGQPIVPPIIHITKVPNPLRLLSGGGMVTYTNKVTNPGTVALSNIQVTDDKCSPLNYISGDVNSNSLLENTETWTYTCRTNLTSTTTNTVVATGVANGLTARDFAVATVVVAAAAPALPNTGFSPANAVALGISLAVIIGTAFILYLTRRVQVK